MPLEAVNKVLDRDDPEGLLRDAAQEAAVASDLVSQWADQCLEPSLPDLAVSRENWNEMFECFVAWAEHEKVGSRYLNRRTNFIGQVRKILGPDRCLDRHHKTMIEQQQDGSADRWWPRLDAGFMLRPDLIKRGILDPVGTPLAQGSLNASALGEGGLARIAQLRPARRTGQTAGVHTAATEHAQGCCTGLPIRPERLQRKEEAVSA
jgi:hypothetical protein